MTRTGDYYVARKKRRDQARALKADLFVSIHADAFTKPSPTVLRFMHCRYEARPLRLRNTLLIAKIPLI